MKPEKQKDALTDLVEIVSTPVTSDQSLSDGEVTTSDGDRVTLGFKALAQKLINAVRIKKSNEETIKRHFTNRDKN
jgi:hypothetical protein